MFAVFYAQRPENSFRLWLSELLWVARPFSEELANAIRSFNGGRTKLPFSCTGHGPSTSTAVKRMKANFLTAFHRP